VLTIACPGADTCDAVLDVPGDKAARFTLAGSAIGGGQRVLNARELKGDPAARSWYVLRYALHGQDILEMETAEADAFKQGGAPTAVIEKGLDGTGVFAEEPLVCLRTKEPTR
jgi:hypothetical protein